MLAQHARTTMNNMNAVIMLLLSTSVLAMQSDMETLCYTSVKLNSRNEIGPDEFKEKFAQTKLKPVDDEATESLGNSEVSVNEKQIEAFAKGQILTGWKYSTLCKKLAAFEITSAKKDLREGYQNENLMVGDSEYRLVECTICLSPCSNARFYCGARHIFCERCLKQNEENGNRTCPNCREPYYRGELNRVGKFAEGRPGKVLQILLVLSFYPIATFLVGNFAYMAVEYTVYFLWFIYIHLGSVFTFIGNVFYYLGLTTKVLAMGTMVAVGLNFLFNKVVHPALNVIQPYNIESAEHTRVIWFSVFLYFLLRPYLAPYLDMRPGSVNTLTVFGEGENY